MVMTVWVETVEPERRLSFRWHPYPVEPADYSSEPTTLVTFTLEDAEGGTLLRLVESGFDEVAAERREEAYRQNEGGWQEQMSNIERHVTAN
jgi:uncharacterized protein YndB with AHSA1/START domain